MEGAQVPIFRSVVLLYLWFHPCKFKFVLKVLCQGLYLICLPPSLILQLETEARTKWHNFDNNMRLSDRAQDIERWQRELEKTLREVDAEAATLQVIKQEPFPRVDS